jgi:ABC-2 type transport system permease protein
LLQLSVVGIGALGGLIAVGMPDLPAVAPGLGVWSTIWFTLGLLFYSFAYAAIGATVSRQADATSAAWPVTMLLIVPYFISLTVLPEDPDGTLARVLSILPLTSPLAMPPRIAVGEPSWVELVTSVVLMVLALAGIMALAGRIYAGAILRSGRRVGLLDAFRSSGETR